MSNKDTKHEPMPRDDKRDDDFARAMEILKEDEAMERYYAKKAGKPC